MKTKIEKITLTSINDKVIYNFLDWLEDSRGNGISTRNLRLAAIHAFYRYVQMQHPEMLLQCQRILAVPLKKTQKSTVNYLPEDVLKELLSRPNQSKKYGIRDTAILCLLYDSGARVQEIIDLSLSDMRLETLIALLFLVGGMTIYRLSFEVTDNGTHSTLTPLITNADFKYMVAVPNDYQIAEVTKMSTLSRVTFASGEHLIVFTESKTELSIAVDTENAYTEITGLSSGFERFYIDKNGTTAIWDYGGYYYELYVSNSTIDILELALTLAKL